MTIRVGLVGYGFSGSVFHAPIISRVEGLSLHTVVSSDPAKVQRDYPTATVVPTLDDLLATPEIDLVVITTPNTTHYPMARQALLAGKHVVVEKPFVLTSAEAAELAALARQQQRVLSVYQNRRWDGDFRTVRALLGSGAMGELTTYEANFDRYRPAVRDRWREQDLPGSGILYDLGPHLIDQALLLFGSPRSVWANLKQQRPGAQAVDAFHLVLDYGRLSVILRAGMLVRQPGPRFALHGTLGSFVKHGLDPQEEALKAGGHPGDAGWGEEPAAQHGHLVTEVGGLTVTGTVATLPGQYQAYYAALAAAIREGAPTPVPADEAVPVMRVIELAMQSAQEQRTLPFA